MDTISFSQMQLILANPNRGETYISPNASTFASLGTSFYITVEKTYYEVSIEKDNDYIWFALDYNKPEPLDDNLTNMDTGEKRKNNRTKKEVELLRQIFFLYHYQSTLLYVSNSNKQNLLASILKEKLQIDFVTKRLYKNSQDFLAVLKKCHKISFTHSNNLFSNDSKKRQALIDLTGTDSPYNFTISADYNKHEIINFIRDLCKEKTENKIDGLSVCGLDESDFGIVYNTESFTKKIEINATKNDNGKFQTELVKSNLILKIATL